MLTCVQFFVAKSCTSFFPHSQSVIKVGGKCPDHKQTATEGKVAEWYKPHMQ